MEQPVYTAKEFASLLGLNKSTLLRMEADGQLPAPQKVDNIRTYMPYDIPRYLQLLGKGPLTQTRKRQIFLNFKGGTGKTSISAFYAYRLAKLGMNVLLIDLDPQGHLTQCLGVNHSSFDITLYNVLIEKTDIKTAIIDTPVKNMKLIPSNLNLSPAELALTSINARELRLRKSLNALDGIYDIIIMDASPAIGLLNLNGILASNELFVPVLADFLSYHGLKILFETIAGIEEDFDFLLDNIYIFLNHYNASHKICIDSKEALERHYSKYLMETIIRQDTKIAEAASMGMPIHQSAPSSRGASDIDAFIREIFPDMPIAF
ncbi:MAG: AAA family ATPase [Thermodesulfobacteriota bacterium]|nr:AAA family ATPase [Thermodesulfobacteriota bacterium]